MWERAGETKHSQTSAASGVLRGREGGALILSHPIGPCSLYALMLTQNPGALIFHAGGYGNLSAGPMVPVDLGAKSHLRGLCTNFGNATSVGGLLNGTFKKERFSSCECIEL